MSSFLSLQLATARVLRDHPDIRGLDCREKVWLLVKQEIPTAKFSTVERLIRKIQNKMKLYLPQNEDMRYILQNEYSSFFKKEVLG